MIKCTDQHQPKESIYIIFFSYFSSLFLNLFYFVFVFLYRRGSVPKLPLYHRPPSLSFLLFIGSVLPYAIFTTIFSVFLYSSRAITLASLLSGISLFISPSPLLSTTSVYSIFHIRIHIFFAFFVFCTPWFIYSNPVSSPSPPRLNRPIPSFSLLTPHPLLHLPCTVYRIFFFQPLGFC